MKQTRDRIQNGEIARGYRASAAMALGLGATMVSSSAMAQPLPTCQPPQGAEGPESLSPCVEERVVLTLRSREPDLVYSVHLPESEAALAACDGDCRMEMPAGRYRIQVTGSPDSDVHQSSQFVTVTHDTTLDVDPARRSRRTSGLAMGITGTALLPVGFTVLLLGLVGEAFDDGFCPVSEPDCAEQSGSDPVNAAVWVGLGMVGAGTVLTPVGWVRFARNRHPKFHEVRGTKQSAGPLSLWLGPRRVGDGPGLGAGFRF